MVDAAANDALDALEACPCCLLGPQQRCLKTPYTHLDNTEVYSDMLRECFNIQLDVASDKCGICEACVVRLRDASHFKRQVQRSQVQLHERLARALKIIEETPLVMVKSETADEDGTRTSDNLSGEELADEPAGSGGGAARLEETPVELADTRTSEDFADCDEPDVSWEAADDDGTRDASSASLKQSEMKTRAQALERTCSVSLDQMFVDTEHHTCRVGLQTYKLSSYSRSPRPIPEGKKNSSRKSTRSNLKNAEMESAGAQKASVSRQVNSVTNEDVGEMPGVKHSKTTYITKDTTPYKCDRCSFSSARKGHLLVHVRIHTGEKPYKCTHCSYASADKSNLRVHERKHTGQKPRKFSHSSHTNAKKSLSLIHERKHTGDRPYKCGYCSYDATQKCHLVVHERRHTGEKPFKCNLCSYASGHRSNFLTHVKNHTGEKPYKCNHCSFASAYRRDFVVHGRKHTGEKPYKCNHCSFATAFKQSILYHQRKHTDEKRYKCSTAVTLVPKDVI